MKALNHRELVEVLFSSCFLAIVSLGMIAVLGYGGYQVFTGVLTIGGMVAFYSYMGRLFDPLRAAVDIYSPTESAWHEHSANPGGYGDDAKRSRTGPTP